MRTRSSDIRFPRVVRGRQPTIRCPMASTTSVKPAARRSSAITPNPFLNARIELPDRRRLHDVEKTEDDKGRRNPQGSPRRNTARGETPRLRPRRSRRDRERRGRALSLPPPRRRSARARRSRRRTRHRESEPAAPRRSVLRRSVPKVPGATGARPAPNPSAIQCAGCRSRKPTFGAARTLTFRYRSKLRRR